MLEPTKNLDLINKIFENSPFENDKRLPIKLQANDIFYNIGDVGQVGIQNLGVEPNLVIAIKKDARRKGWAEKALRTLINKYNKVGDLPLNYRVWKENKASRNLAEKLGFKKERIEKSPEGEEIIYVYPMGKKAKDMTKMIDRNIPRRYLQILAKKYDNDLEFSRHRDDLIRRFITIPRSNPKGRAFKDVAKDSVAKNFFNKRVYSKLNEQMAKKAVGEGIETDLNQIQDRWRQALGDLYYLSNGYRRIQAGKEWGDWDAKEIEKKAAKIVDALRGVYFPFLMPEKGSDQYNKVYWQMIRNAQPYMNSSPPSDNELDDWKEKRQKHINLERQLPSKWLNKKRLG